MALVQRARFPFNIKNWSVKRDRFNQKDDGVLKEASVTWMVETGMGIEKWVKMGLKFTGIWFAMVSHVSKAAMMESDKMTRGQVKISLESRASMTLEIIP